MPTPRPSPGPSPPPPPGYTPSPVGDGFAGALGDLERTRGLVSDAADEALQRLPDNAKTRRVRDFLEKARHWAEGGTKTVPVVPRGVSRKIPGGGPTLSKVGLVVDLITNLAEGDDPREAVEDTGRGALFGAVGWVATAFAGPLRIFGVDPYTELGQNYDEWLAQAREWERTNPTYLERVEREEETGYAYTCDEYSAMGFKPQDVEGCEE